MVTVFTRIRMVVLFDKGAAYTGAWQAMQLRVPFVFE